VSAETSSEGGAERKGAGPWSQKEGLRGKQKEAEAEKAHHRPNSRNTLNWGRS